MSKKPWYHAGLKFTCSGCGDCCTGSPGYVWVTDQEIVAIAEHLEMDPETFEDHYTRRIGARKSLKEFPTSYDCVFLDTDNNGKRNCSIYSVRPEQCRTWPFWDSNLESPEAWEEACDICPGSGSGKLHQLQHIEEQRKIVRV